MKIVRYATINHTPAIVLATKGWLEANIAGMGEAVASIHWEQKGIVAFDVDEPIGVITWTHHPFMSAVFAEQVYVEAPWRRRGVFKAMWADLNEQAAALGVPSIKLGTHPKNDIALGVYERMDGEPTGIFLQFPVKRPTTP